MPSARTAAAANTWKLTHSPRSSTTRYSQNRPMSRMSRSDSDTPAPLAQVLRDELAQPLRARRAEDLGRRPLFLDQAVVQEQDAIGDVARELHLVRDHDHRRAVVRELAHHGRLVDSDRLLAAGSRAHPAAASLMLVGAQLRFERKELAEARRLLADGGHSGYTLDERREAEELVAKIEESSGNMNAAVLARARARMLTDRLSETQGGSGANKQ